MQLLHRQIESTALSVIEADPVLSRRLSSLSLWTTLQALGRDAIANRLTLAFESCRHVYNIVSKCEGIRVLVSVDTLNYIHTRIDINRHLCCVSLFNRANHQVANKMVQYPI